MAESTLHGTRWEELEASSFPIATLRSSVIGLVGTAPLADATAFPLNKPVLIAGSRLQAAKLVASAGADEGTLPGAIASIFAQAGAMVVVVRVAKGVDEAATLANVAGGVSGGVYTGVHALTVAESSVGVRPRILAATGWTHQRPPHPTTPSELLANPVAAELKGIAKKLGAEAIIDGPSTTDEAAIDMIADYGEPEIVVCEPWILRTNAAGAVVPQPASACVAGLRAKIDSEKGFWWSCSNQTIAGIVGLHRPIDFVDGDENCTAQLLNDSKINCIINSEGFRYWGGLTASSAASWRFASVRRAMVMISDSITRASREAVDKGITRTFLDYVVDSVEAYCRSLKTRGALVAFKVWADPELNTPDRIQLGKVYINLKLTFVYPAYEITFGVQSDPSGLVQLFEAA